MKHTLSEIAQQTIEYRGQVPNRVHFKRPEHMRPYHFRGGQLLEGWSDSGRTEWPRLSAEDLTATDWEWVR